MRTPPYGVGYSLMALTQNADDYAIFVPRKRTEWLPGRRQAKRRQRIADYRKTKRISAKRKLKRMMRTM